MSTVGVIPARWASTRFPGKPLATIAGVSLIERVYRRACAARRLDCVVVATDDPRIAEAARGFGAAVAMTGAHHPTGTDRIAEAVQGRGADVIVNIQGDEPLADPASLDRLVDLLARRPDRGIATLAHPVERQAATDANRVKVVVSQAGDALYFSRSPVPYQRDAAVQLLQHIGAYAYRAAALSRFVALPRTPAERAEGLEQLRALEHGMMIAVGIVDDWVAAAVDIPDDIGRVEAILARRGGTGC